MKKKSFSPISKFRRSRNQLFDQNTNDQKLGQVIEPMPSSEEIQIQFDKVLQELALPQEKIQAMMLLPENKKWLMLQQNKNKDNEENTKKASVRPMYYIKIIKEYLEAIDDNPKVPVEAVQELEVSLRTEPIRWVKEFFIFYGLQAIVDLTYHISKKINLTNKEKELRPHCLRCYKALMNHGLGLQTIMEHKNAINILSLCLSWPEPSLQSLVIQLLASVALVEPNGHSIVVRAMSYYQKQMHEEFRFQRLMYLLQNDEDDSFTPEMLECQVSCLAFINSIIASPDDLEYRVVLLEQFMDIGLIESFTALRQFGNPDLNIQLETLESIAQQDFQTISEEKGLNEVDLFEIDDAFKALRQSIKDNASESWCLRVFQSLLLLPIDRHRKPKFWNLIYCLINEVVLQRFGINPDVSVIQMDIDNIIASLVQQEEYEKAMASAQHWEKVVSEWEVRMEEWKKYVEQAKQLESIIKSKDEELRKTRHEMRVASEKKKESDKRIELLEEYKKNKEEEMEKLKMNIATKNEEEKQRIEKYKILNDKLEALNNSKLIMPLSMTNLKKEVVINLEEAIKENDFSLPENVISTLQSFVNSKIKEAISDNTSSETNLPRKVSSSNEKTESNNDDNGTTSNLPPHPPKISGLPPPPPPPLPGVCGKAPPPPPPMVGGIPPPPMPGAGGIYQGKLKIVTTTKMKPILWSKIAPTQIGSTFWKTVADKREAEEKIRNEIDLNELSEIFCAVSPKTPSSASLLKSAESISANTRASTQSLHVSILDAKRNNNISIIISRLKLDFNEISKYIMNLDKDYKLPENILKICLSNYPTQEETEALSKYLHASEEQLKELNKAETFLLNLIKIPKCHERLKAISFKSQFKERVADIKPDISTIISASKEIKYSSKLAKILEIILSIGNYMNGDSFRGGAFGFNIDLLTKLQEIKSSDNKSTFMNYLSKIISRHYPDILKIKDDLPNLEKASKISTKAINQEMSDLERGMINLQKELNIQDDSKEFMEYHDALLEFLNNTEPEFDELVSNRSEMDESFKSVVEFYGEDIKTSTSESFFGIFWTFIKEFEKALKENESDRKSKMSMLNKLNLKTPIISSPVSAPILEEEEKRTERKLPVKKSITIGDGEDAERRGLMDELITSLKSGDVFKSKIKHAKEESYSKKHISQNIFSNESMVHSNSITTSDSAIDKKENKYNYNKEYERKTKSIANDLINIYDSSSLNSATSSKTEKVTNKLLEPSAIDAVSVNKNVNKPDLTVNTNKTDADNKEGKEPAGDDDWLEKSVNDLLSKINS